MSANVPAGDPAAGPAAWQRPLILVGALLGLLVAGTLALWVHYGTTVFYEMVLAGLAACF